MTIRSFALAAAALAAAPAAAVAHAQAGPHLHPHGAEAGPLAVLALVALIGAAAWRASRR